MLFSRLLDATRTALRHAVPTQCAICHGWGDDRICATCRSRYAAPVARCERCALQVPETISVCGACLREPPAYDSALAALAYAHPWDRLIAPFKFHAALDLAPALARCLVDASTQRRLPHPGLLLPVPLSAPRQRERGYNQSWEIARRLGRMLACPADARLLLRIKDTPHQLALPVERRAANVRGAFAIEPARRAELRGRKVTLVDDVLTTGATAAEITGVLRQAGASEVHLWVLARTPAPSD
ncbi:MAG TPA: ComF family protein [Albitalea sp.]|nr:ComF family protein [Albitalea sp.]